METNLRGSRGDRTTIVRLCSCDNKLCLRCRRYVYLTQCSERGRRPSASLQCFRIITRYQRHELAVTAVAARRPDVSSTDGGIRLKIRSDLFFDLGRISEKCWNANWDHFAQWVTVTFAERFRLVFSLSGFANLSTKITTKREFRLSSAEREHLAIPLSESD